MFGLFKKKIKLDTKVESYPFELKSFTLPQLTANWRLYGQGQNNWDAKKAVTEGYQSSAVVYACVEKRAKLIASVPWYVKIGDNEAPDDHPLSRLLKRPNSDQSLYEFMYSLSQTLDLTGNCFMTEVRAGSANKPVQLWQIETDRVKIHRGNINLVDNYSYNGESGKADIPTADMIQIRMPNPQSPVWGMPVLMGASIATDVDREAGAFQKVSFQNRGLSDISVKMPEGATQAQADATRDALKKRQQGPANARAPIVTNGEVSQLNQTAAEMDFVNSRKSVWTEIAAAFGVPLSAIGFTENVNLANADAMNKQLWEATIIPQLDLITQQLNSQLAVEFGDNVEICYDLSNITALQEAYDKKLENARKLFDMGVPFDVINERLELGFEAFAGSDVGYLSSSLLPGGIDLDSEI